MEREGTPASGGNGDDVARLIALTERQHELWGLLREAQDDALRNQLFDELSANREELARLKDTVSARVDPLPAPTPPAEEPPLDPPRSVGEELRANILIQPEDVAPSSPPPPPPPTSPPPLVEPPRPQPPAPPIVPDRPVESLEPGPPQAELPEPESLEPEPRQSEPSPTESSEAPLDAPIGLAPERTPFSSREADLAATRARQATSRRRPEPEPEPEPQPSPEESKAAESALRRAEERAEAAHSAYRDLQRVRPKHERSFSFLAILVAVAAVAVVVWFIFFRGGESSEATVPATTTTVAGVVPSESPVAQIRAVLDGLGLSSIAVEDRSGTIFLSGVLDSDADRSAALGATQALAAGARIDGTGLVVGVTDDAVRSAVLQAIADAGHDKINVAVTSGVATLSGVTPDDGAAGLIAAVSAVPGIDQVVDLTETSDRSLALDAELQRITSVTPIVFASGQTGLSILQERILDSVAEIIQAYDGPLVTIVGYTDSAGSAADNTQISLIRAESVRDYLVDQGISANRLLLDARGEESSSGSAAVAGLERRVEFEVGYSVAAGSAEGAFRIGIVAPSARDDFAFTQSIVDAVDVIAEEFDGLEVDVTDNSFVTDEAATAIRSYAAAGFDLVIAHGSQYGTSLVEIANEFPDIAFAWGTAADTFGLANVSSYEVASDQGGYVMGVISALLTESEVVGVVGPLEVGDAELFVNGFSSGVLATNAGVEVPILYTGSFSDVALAAEAATAHIDAGADILTGTAQMVVGAIGVAGENDALWFGTQSNQTDLAPDLVVASQVYHWEVVLRQIVTGIQQGSRGGEAYTIDLENGGIAIEYNTAIPLPADIISAADDTIAGIIAGSISTGS